MAAVFDAASSAANGSSGNSLSWSHTIGGLGSTGLIIVGAEGEDTSSGQTNQRITGITFNSVSMTLVDSDEITAPTHSVSVAMYKLSGSDIPPAGTYTVTVSYTGNCESRVAGVASFKGIKDQAAIDTDTNNQTSTAYPATLSATVAPSVDSLLVSVFGMQNTSGASSFTTGETEAWNKVVGSIEDSNCLGGYNLEINGSTTSTVSVDNPESEVIVLAAFEIAPSSGGNPMFFSNSNFAIG